jgi:3-hydroxyacyl-CoA dehydrogenase
MADSRLLGDKTGSGFYKKVIEDDGARRILVLDTRSMTYREMGQVQFDSLDAAKRIADTCSRIMTLYYASDKAGIFTFRTRSDEFIYAANRIPEIAGDILTIDNALKWGFNREMGPFEMWDAVGPKRSAALMESHGYKIPSWVRRMLNKGFKTFYTSDNGKRYHYDPLTDDYREDTKKR